MFHFNYSFFLNLYRLPNFIPSYLEIKFVWLGWWWKSMAIQNTLRILNSPTIDCIEFNININAPSGQSSDESGSSQGQRKNYFLYKYSIFARQYFGIWNHQYMTSNGNSCCFLWLVQLLFWIDRTFGIKCF